MKKLLLILAILAALVAAVAIYLSATTPSQSRGVRFPLASSDQSLIAHVPASAEAFALIPTAAALEGKLRANPVTREAIESWSSKQRLPQPWMVGSADILAWRDEGKTRYYLRLDPVRAILVRLYLMVAGDIGDTVVINAPAEEPIPADERQQIEALAAKLPAGDAFVVQRRSGRGAYPPIGRPAVSSVAISPDQIRIVSRAASNDPPSPPLTASFPKSAMLSATFSSAPRIIDDLNRLFGARVSSLMANGGSIALYDVEIGKLLPRPIGVFGVPADRRADFDQFVQNLKQGEGLGYEVRTGERNGQLLLSLDRSLDLYIKDAAPAENLPSARWAVRADPARLVPILSQLSDNLGLRIASPRISRGVRDANHWIGALGKATGIEAVDLTDSSAEELRVGIATR